MSGLGGLNKSQHGVVVGLVQLQLPVVETPSQLAAQTRRNQGSMGLVVFPGYALHGLSMSTVPELMVSLDGSDGTFDSMGEGMFFSFDGTSCGFDAPTRSYKGPEPQPLVPDSVVANLKKAA